MEQENLNKIRKCVLNRALRECGDNLGFSCCAANEVASIHHMIARTQGQWVRLLFLQRFFLWHWKHMPDLQAKYRLSAGAPKEDRQHDHHRPVPVSTKAGSVDLQHRQAHEFLSSIRLLNDPCNDFGPLFLRSPHVGESGWRGTFKSECHHHMPLLRRVNHIRDEL